MNDSLGPAALLALYGAVAFGSIIPVIPTGAAVSAAAVVALTHDPWELVVVLMVGAAGAYTGDLVTYAVLRVAGEPLAQRVGWLSRDDPSTTLHRLRATIERNELRTLLISRLVPAGRIPVLLVASLGGYPWVRFASAAVASTVLWSAFYSLIGVLGHSIFPDTTVAIVVVVIVSLLVTVVAQLVQSRRARAAAAPDAKAS